jgi:hypothetical protein
MGFKWNNVIKAEARGIPSVKAYDDERRRAQAERSQEIKRRRERAKENSKSVLKMNTNSG